jgi:magnesium transporter
MIDYYKRLPQNRKLKKLKDFESGCWINVINPSDEEIESLAKDFDLDKQNLISGIDKNEVPRVEKDEKELYVILKILSSNQKELDTMLILLTSKFILTLTRTQPKFINQIVNGTTKFITTQRIGGMLILLSKINAEFEKATLTVARNVNAEKAAVIGKLSERDIGNLLIHEESLNSFVSSYHYTNLVYERINKHINFKEERNMELMEDLVIEAKQGADLCKSSLKTISNLRNHLEVSLSNKLNKVITLLTIFTIIVSVPAAISGLYGMNVLLPMQDDPNIFFYVLGLIAITWASFILYLKKRTVI